MGSKVEFKDQVMHSARSKVRSLNENNTNIKIRDGKKIQKQQHAFREKNSLNRAKRGLRLLVMRERTEGKAEPQDTTDATMNQPHSATSRYISEMKKEMRGGLLKGRRNETGPDVAGWGS